MTPIVIVHEDYQDYLKSSIEISGKNNKIYLIGNKSVEFLEDHPSVSYVNIQKYLKSDKIVTFNENFVHYGDKDRRTYMFWFTRMLIMYEFAKDYNLDSFFSCDSDNVVLKRVDDIPFKFNNALTISKEWEPFHYAASVHSGLLTLDFCRIYEQILFDYFLNKKKNDFFEDKINFHRSNPGAFCDMTIYYYMVKMKLLEFDNLLEPRKYLDKNFVFTQGYSSSEGLLSTTQYRMKRKKLYIQKDNKLNSNYIINTDSREKEYLLNLHFQGKQKKQLNSRIVNWLNY